MAYEAAVWLKRFVQTIQEDSKSDIYISNSKVELLSNELSYLGSFLKTMRFFPRNATIDVRLESGVNDAILELKNVIVPYIYRDESLTLEVSQQLIQVREKISLFLKTLKSDEEYKRREEQSCSNFRSTTSAFIGKKNMVGFHDQLSQLKDLVLVESNEKHRLIIVTGMTGTGKTALVQEIYKDPLVAEHFEAYLFLSFGPGYQMKEILLLALHQLGVKFQENDSVEQLQECVKVFLAEKRYLVVLDDVWNDDSGFLDLCEHIMQGDAMSSCIVITTQKQSLIPYYSGYVHVRLLNDEESWNLLRQIVFTSEEEEEEERCDPQLAKIGKEIAKNCEGLPSAIIQVGELLRNTEKTVQEWKIIAEKEDPISITTEDNTPLSNALSLSYNMLPQHLKVCFLYMGVFPKKYEICRSKLIQLWVSEGFIPQRNKKSSEKTAGKYLDEIVSHSCVLTEAMRSISRSETKSCRLHFTFRSLCVSEAKREKFFHVIKKYEDCFPENIDSQQRLCIQNNVVLAFKEVQDWMESAPEVCSFLCYGPKQPYPIVLYLPFRLLKVLDILSIRFCEFPDQVVDLFELTYLAITCDGELPPSISCLQKLQVLIFRAYHEIIKPYVSCLPIEIWKLSKLKHLYCIGFDLPDPSSIDNCDSLILGSLLTLSGVSAHSCTPGVLVRMPNLKRIGIKIYSLEMALSNLMGNFTSVNHVFESFKCVVMYPKFPRPQVVPFSTLNFPENVRKITLSGCGFPWEHMRVIGALPNLKVLKLRCYAFCGPKWIVGETREELVQFPSLEYLLLEDLDIQHLVVNIGDHLVWLDRLVIRHCYELQEISNHMLFMKQIKVEDCNISLVKQIQDRQGYPLPHINSSWDG